MAEVNSISQDAVNYIREADENQEATSSYLEDLEERVEALEEQDDVGTQ